jgi:phosphoserine phosphatase
MSHVLSLIAGAGTALEEEDVDRVRGALDKTGARSGRPLWLAPDGACEIFFAGNCDAALAAARSASSGRPIDVNAMPDSARRKRLLVIDLDSTIIEQEVIDELAAEAGMGPEVAAITERAMRGEILFPEALRRRVGYLKGLPTHVVDRLLAERISVSRGAAALVSTMRREGAYTALVTGSFTAFAGPVGETLGFDEFRANRLLTDAGAFTGLVDDPIVDSAAKERTLVELAERLGLLPAETLAVGDGANDVPMIRRAGLGVAYRGKPMLRAAADAEIVHGDLTGVLYLQGYQREEFVEAAAA